MCNVYHNLVEQLLEKRVLTHLFRLPYRIYLPLTLVLYSFASFPQQVFSQNVALPPYVEMKAVIRDVIFRQMPPKRSRVGLFEQIFLSSHRSPESDLIAREFLFADGDEVPPSYIVQSALNLYSSGLFRTVRFELDTSTLKGIDVTAILEERPQVAPFLIAETGGGVASVGAGVDLANLGGVGASLKASVQYRTYNDIGVQAEAELNVRHVLEWFNLKGRVLVNRYRNEQEVSLQFPFSADSPYFEGELAFSRLQGKEFFYKPINSGNSALEAAQFDLKDFESNRLSAFGVVRGWSWATEFFLMGNIVAEATHRADASLFRIGDNSFRFHPGFALERRQMQVSEGAFDWKRFGTPIQGWYLHSWFGVIASPVLLNLSDANFCTRVGVKGFLGERVYAAVHGELSGFLGNGGLTYGLFNVAVHGVLTKDIVLAGRIVLENANQFLRPRNGAGEMEFVRGYGVNTTIGWMRNRAQMELRGLPIGEVGAYRLTGVIFLDAGSIANFSNQSGIDPIVSFGAGVRLKYPSFMGGEGTIRVDVAFVPSLGRFGQLIISTQEAFRLFEDFPSKQHHILGEQRWIE